VCVLVQEYLYAHLRRSMESHGEVVEWTYTMLHTLHNMEQLPPPVAMFKMVSRRNQAAGRPDGRAGCCEISRQAVSRGTGGLKGWHHRSVLWTRSSPPIKGPVGSNQTAP
jgi:hypothetical protein